MRPTTAFVVAEGRPVEPFGDPPADARILNRRLADVQRETLLACGVRTVTPIASRAELPAPSAATGGAYLVLADDLFVTASLLRAFLEEAAGGARLALTDSRIVRDSLPLQALEHGLSADGRAHWIYPVWLVTDDPGSRPLASLPAVAVDPKEEIRTLEGVPAVFSPDRAISFPITPRIAIRVQHWLHLLRANHLAMMASLAALRERSRIRNWLAIAALLVRAFPPTEARVLRAMVRRGRKVKIHPTAVVEGAVLGDGARVGAHAVVRFSVLGPGAVVEEFGLVELSVLGEGACVTKKGISTLNVLYPGAVLGHAGCQMSLLGRDAFVSTDSRLLDLKFDGDVPVEVDGRRVSSGSRFLGSCVGHGASVGAGVFLQYGMAVPNGVALVKEPREVVRRIEEGREGAPLVVEGGVARPMRGARRTTPRGSLPGSGSAP